MFGKKYQTPYASSYHHSKMFVNILNTETCLVYVSTASMKTDLAEIEQLIAMYRHFQYL